uniref:PGG domain-containing protein n=1 Tax=Chenopodium quinoa TaxID=63459 RepID=A0A803KPZ3_CHEQI
MDTELISNMPSGLGSSLVYEAIFKKMSKLALQILRSPHPISCSVIESEKNVMFLAVENECHAVAEEILTIIDNKGWTQLLTNHRNLTVLHLAPLCTEAYKKNNLNWDEKDIDMLPWFEKNKENEGPLHLAIRHKHEDLALYILSLVKNDQKVDLEELLDYFMPEHSTLFLAMENNCVTVAKFILENLDKDERAKYLKNFLDGRNILHLATDLVDEKFGALLVNEEPELITEKDNNGQSSWDKAFELGRVWFIQAALEKKPTVFDSEPRPWIKACENGHVSALRAFIDHIPREFLYLCIEYKDSPLHHIKLSSLKHYEEFLKIPRMMDLINLQDSTGATPLHKAIQNADLLLTETLLTIDMVLYDIKNDENVSAIDLLAQKCEDNQACPWDKMCKRHGLNPKIKTTYFRAKTNLLDVRNSLFVVAALLATITFTAGFTPPGGFTQDTGEATLAKKATFLVFLVSDTLALFFSMLVLICLIWSMVYESSQSLFLIDRSMVLLRFALNNTLLAFMTGVYVVIAPKSLWAAIFIIVIVSSLIGISISKTLLYKALLYLDKFFPSQNMKKCRDRFHLMELGCISNKNE